MNKQVSERDIRLPQFKDAELDDLEFDSSGDVVRKDRFENSMRKIQGILHGINGLSARSGWTCEQVVDAVRQTINQFQKFKDLTIALNSFPEDAEFYHPENKTYIKNIDKYQLMEARKEPESSHSINHETLEIGGYDWQEDSAFLEYIDILLSVDDIREKIKSMCE